MLLKLLPLLLPGDEILKNITITKARSVAYMNVKGMDPEGRLFLPDFVREIAQYCTFQEVPSIAEAIEKKEGIEFGIGRLGGKVIDVLKLFDTLIWVETHSNTVDSENVIKELTLWANDQFGLKLGPDMIRHWTYVNDVAFQADIPLLNESCAALTNVAAKTGAALSEIWQEDIEYLPTVITAGHDPAVRQYGIAPFTIQRRVGNRFSENMYFSEAPLPTDLHIKLLEEFEADVKAQAGL
jgi:hypothetical protein